VNYGNKNSQKSKHGSGVQPEPFVVDQRCSDQSAAAASSTFDETEA
jgi:hypothetical protein